MYTNQPIRIHSKCLSILELIQKVNIRIENEKGNLLKWDRGQPTSFFRLIHKRENIVADLETTARIAARLERYYKNTLAHLHQSIIIASHDPEVSAVIVE